jgi:hypothetical protein
MALVTYLIKLKSTLFDLEVEEKPSQCFGHWVEFLFPSISSNFNGYKMSTHIKCISHFPHA